MEHLPFEINFNALVQTYLKNSLVGTPFPHNFLCGNAVSKPSRQCHYTPLVKEDQNIAYTYVE